MMKNSLIKISSILIIVFLILLVVFKYLYKSKYSVSFTKTSDEKSGETVVENPFSNLVKEEYGEIPPSDLGGPLYPGFGDITAKTKESYIVVTKKDSGGKDVSFDILSNRDLYSEELYIIEEYPVHDYLYYSVGLFKGWEDIEGSSDKYLLVDYKGYRAIRKFRTASERSDLFGPEITGYYISYIEDDLKQSSSSLNEVDPVSAFESITHQQAVNILKEGDPVVVFTVSRFPELAKKDLEGNYLASFVIIRKHYE